jgi:hypothetical protein
MPTLRAVLDRRWLIEQIDECEARVSDARRRARKSGYGSDWIGWAIAAASAPDGH